MKLSTFNNEKDNDPKLIEATWEGLESSLRQVRKCVCSIATCHRSDCAGKLGQAWNPAYWGPGDTRKASLTREVCAFVIDLDKLSDLSLLENLEDYKLIIHGSHSDSPAERCLRVIVAMTKPVSGKDWPRFWDAAMEYLNIPLGKGGADRACRDSSRIYFLPSRPYDACHDTADGSGFLFESRDGILLDVDAVFESIIEDDSPGITYTAPPEFKGAPSPENWQIAVESLAGGWPDTGRNSAQLALCGALAHAGWPVELIADFVSQVCELAHPGNGDRQKRLKSARYSVDKISRGEPVTGWPGVLEYVDHEVVETATSALGIGPQGDDNFVKTFLNLQNKVVVTRDDIALTLKGAKNKLTRSSSVATQKEGLYINRALKGEAFTTHADEDKEKATTDAVHALVKHAPRGTPTLLLAEHIVRSRPDLSVDEISTLVETAKLKVQESERKTAVDDTFKLNQYGQPVAHNLFNFDLALSNLGVKFYFDSFSRRKYVEVTSEGNLFRDVVEDHHINSLAFEIERRFDFYPMKDKFRDYCDHLARENSFHPVRDYLASLPSWDGVPRLDSWLIKLGGAEDTPYVRAVSWIILVAAVRRVRQPGTKFDEMLILESPQGTGKSTAVKSLCPEGEWFTDNFNLEGDSKRMIEQTSGKWIIEAGELRGMTVKDHNALKQYLSSTHDEARMAYARESIRQAREFIIIGTTNDSQYLRDHTGDRRYWPVKISRFDIDGLLEIRDQLWAEAVYLDLANAHNKHFIRLDPELWSAAAVEQAKRKVDNAIKIRLEDYLNGHSGRIRTSDVWKLLTDDHVPQQSLVMQASNAMQELGWEKERFQVGGKRESYYIKGKTDKQLVVVGRLDFGLAVKAVDVDSEGNPMLEQLKSVTAN